MTERQLVVGGFYKHFKDKLYQVRGIAYHSETKEKMVVYQAMYGDFSMYVRPYDMFMSEVDHYKYPDVTQTYRFEQVDLKNPGADTQVPLSQAQAVSTDSAVEPQIDLEETEVYQTPVEETSASQSDEKIEKISYEPYADRETEDGVVDGRLLRFLDAENFNEKLNVLTYLKSGLDDKIIDAMGASLDAEIPAGNIEERYRSLRSVILAHSKYECTRLRE